MALSVSAFGRLRPYLYHVTAQRNLKLLRQRRVLLSAKRLAELSNRRALLARRRLERDVLPVETATVQLHDQRPLHFGAVDFLGGWTKQDLLQAVNGFVFFWPGDEAGPISYGRGHLETYASTDVLIRLPFDDVSSAYSADRDHRARDRDRRFC